MFDGRWSLHVSGILFDTIAEMSIVTHSLRNLDNCSTGAPTTFGCAMYHLLRVVQQLQENYEKPNKNRWKVLLKVLMLDEVKSHVIDGSGFDKVQTSIQEVDDCVLRLALVHYMFCAPLPCTEAAPEEKGATVREPGADVMEILGDVLSSDPRVAPFYNILAESLGEIGSSVAGQDQTVNQMIRMDPRLYRDLEILAQTTDLSGKRCVIRTRTNNCLGAAPTCAEPGDQIWLLYDARIPYVLRPYQIEEGRTSYRIIGQAWIHGIMNGEYFESHGTLNCVEQIEIQ